MLHLMTGLGNHGHYIMFYINAQEDAELTTEEVDKNAKGSVADDPSQKYSHPKYLRQNLKVNQSYSMLDLQIKIEHNNSMSYEKFNSNR